MDKSQKKKKRRKKELKNTLLLHIVLTRRSPGREGGMGEGGGHHLDKCVWVAPTISWGRARLGSWGGAPSRVSLILNPEATPTYPAPPPYPTPTPPTLRPQAPPRSVVAFVIVIWPCLLNASTVYSLRRGLVWTGVSRTQGVTSLWLGGGVWRVGGCLKSCIGDFLGGPFFLLLFFFFTPSLSRPVERMS